MCKGLIPLALLASMFTPAASASNSQPSVDDTAHQAACLSVRDVGNREPCRAAEASIHVDAPTQYWICSVESIYFSDCLAQLADEVVRIDPKQPPAQALYRIVVKNPATGTTEQADVLTADDGEISDIVGATRFTLATHRAVDGSIMLSYRLAGAAQAQGSRSLRAGDQESVVLGSEVVTISRL
ncbi:hypothetical protein [Dyella sp. GSA-30]|uniref:hypothetical protein n=1 Tax=Dyella sp. GSA-30 TaxID=2994496 RepID=UPI0024907C21|nr:hypothetical protein [Dyella sp. GSA-30]BDU20106.1 hypothetical protein DYGSA30_15630 [Dyella sp. GSA-30]